MSKKKAESKAERHARLLKRKIVVSPHDKHAPKVSGGNVINDDIKSETDNGGNGDDKT